MSTDAGEQASLGNRSLEVASEPLLLHPSRHPTPAGPKEGPLGPLDRSTTEHAQLSGGNDRGRSGGVLGRGRAHDGSAGRDEGGGGNLNGRGVRRFGREVGRARVSG